MHLCVYVCVEQLQNSLVEVEQLKIESQGHSKIQQCVISANVRKAFESDHDKHINITICD